MMRASWLAGLVFLASTPAAADPVVGAGGTPGVATSWSAQDNAVVLKVMDGFSADDVADAIKSGVVGTTVSVDDTSVRVTGISMDELVVALEKIDVTPELDDIDEVFAAIRSGPEEAAAEGSGSSIRATRKTSFEAFTVSATVKAVTHRRFPLMLLSVEIDEGAGPLVSKEPLTIVPHIGPPDGARAQKNLAAWYARPGDRIRITLTRKTSKAWVADTYERGEPAR